MEKFIVDKKWVKNNYHGEAEFTIPDGASVIDKGAFGCCESLTSIHIPDSVMRIRDWAFAECKKLTSIHIPDSVTRIENCAFKNCDNLTIQCNKESYAEKYAKEHDIPVVYNKEQKKEEKSIEHDDI